MALFPKCKFQVFLRNSGVLVAGERNEGTLVLHVPEHIPRAEHIYLDLHSEAWAGYGSGKSRRVERHQLLHLVSRVDLPKEGMPPGEHSYPFAFDLPPWLPPQLAGYDCAITHELKATLDVDWAIDPVERVFPRVVRPTGHGRRSVLVARSPNGFHDRIVLEATLSSSVVTEGEPLDGKIALRAGADAKFDAVVLTLARVATVVMGRGDARRTDLAVIRIPAARLLGGEAVAFTFPPQEDTVPSFRSGHIDNSYVLHVACDIPWGFDPEFSVPFEMLPRGSVLEGELGSVALGSERRRQIAHYVASRTGLTEGTSPVLVHGREGPVRFALVDAPREGALGIEAALTYPKLGVDIRMRPLGMLDGFRQSPLLPAELQDKFFLRVEPPKDRFDREPLGEPELHALLGGLGLADEVRIDDHRLAFHQRVEDDAEWIAKHAENLVARAKVLASIIARLPFPKVLAHTRPTWEATAVERSGSLVPSVPAIDGMSLGVRTIGGEERSFELAIVTVWEDGLARTEVDLSFPGFALPEHALPMLAGKVEHAMLGSLRGTFVTLAAEGRHAIRAFTSKHVDDPRALFPAIEGLVAWVLEVRGERRADAPYR